MCHNQNMSSPELTTSGEFYDEVKGDQEFEAEAKKVEMLARKAEVADTSETDEQEQTYWEMKMATVTSFDREKAKREFEAYKKKRRKEIETARKERLATVIKVLEDGSIEGREQEVARAILELSGQLNSQTIKTYEHYLHRRTWNKDPEVHQVGEWSVLYPQECKDMRGVKKIPANIRASLDRLAAFEHDRLEGGA